jgi:maltooligosyltrehalose trehalohydrolase
MLLGPATPMLFQGQEFASSRPFLYFADHSEELADGIRSGRREFLSQFPSVHDRDVQEALPSPTDDATFMACKLDLSERDAHRDAYAFHRDLLALRHQDPVLSRAGVHRPEGAVLGSGVFLLRYADVASGDRLLVVNLAGDLDITSAPEPLLAPPDGHRWRLSWSSEAPAYGGHGTPDIDTDVNWRMPAGCALFFTSVPRSEQDSHEGHDTQD